jgi:hypothetical protein
VRTRHAIVAVMLALILSATPTVVHAGYCTSLTDCFRQDPFFWTLVFILALAALAGLAMLLGPSILALFAEAGEVAEGVEAVEAVGGDLIEREELQGLLNEIRGAGMDCGQGAKELLEAAGEAGSPTPVSGVGEHYVAHIGDQFIDTVPNFWDKAFGMNAEARAAINEAVPGLAGRLTQGATMTAEEFNALQNALVKIGGL